MPAYTMTAPVGVGAAPPAAQEAMRQQAAALLQRTFRWLETAIPMAPQLSSAVPSLITSVQLYQAGQYGASLNQVTSVLGNLRQARWAYPTLPPL